MPRRKRDQARPGASTKGKRGNAEAQREYRRRRDAGEAVLPVPLDVVDVATFLLEQNAITEAEQDDRRALGRALANVLKRIIPRGRYA